MFACVRFELIAASMSGRCWWRVELSGPKIIDLTATCIRHKNVLSVHSKDGYGLVPELKVLDINC